MYKCINYQCTEVHCPNHSCYPVTLNKDTCSIVLLCRCTSYCHICKCHRFQRLWLKLENLPNSFVPHIHKMFIQCKNMMFNVNRHSKHTIFVILLKKRIIQPQFSNRCKSTTENDISLY